MRTLTLDEIYAVSGGHWVSALKDAFLIGYAVGQVVFNNLSQEQKDAIGGTVDAALHNLGIKEAEDIPS